MEAEKLETDDTFSVNHKDNEVEARDGVSGILGVSLTDPTGVDLLASEHNLVACFCKTGHDFGCTIYSGISIIYPMHAGSADCPKCLFAMEPALQVFVEKNLNISYRFLVVECDAPEDVQRFEASQAFSQSHDNFSALFFHV